MNFSIKNDTYVIKGQPNLFISRFSRQIQTYLLTVQNYRNLDINPILVEKSTYNLLAFNWKPLYSCFLSTKTRNYGECVYKHNISFISMKSTSLEY